MAWNRYTTVLIILLNLLLGSTHAFADPSKNAGYISLSFQDIPVKTALQLLAEFSGFNAIISDKAQGNLALHLDNMPWEEALDIILRSQGLSKRQTGHVLFIAPQEEITKREKEALQAQQQLRDLAPLKSELIQIHYGKATDVANLLKDKNNTLLSRRGSVNVDQRTNSIWVQDNVNKLIEIRRVIQQLDIPAKQVLIEVRVVNIDNHFEQELGIRFGVSQASGLTGTLEGANQLAQGNAPTSLPLAQRLNVDLPVVGQPSGPLSLGLAIARLGKGTLLDLELSAMESEGSAQILSSPRLITADQQTAIIEAGEEIPYQEKTSGGNTSIAFKKAVLSLNVTPQITPDHQVILTLKVSQDQLSNIRVLDVPVVNTREIQTQVLVEDKETVVLGGIYEQSQNQQTQRTPFLASIPILGHLFKHNKKSDTRKELLIFVTPYILQQVHAEAEHH